MIQASELILNPDGSVYHLNLKPEHIAHDIIFVGDQNRVEKISSLFDTIEFSFQKREFKTHTGTLNRKRISVISTGIGPDNIDIVMNELDALVKPGGPCEGAVVACPSRGQRRPPHLQDVQNVAAE